MVFKEEYSSVKAILLDFGESELKREEMMAAAFSQMAEKYNCERDRVMVLNQWRYKIALRLIVEPSKTYEKYFVERSIQLSLEEVLIEGELGFFTDKQKKSLCHLWYQSVFKENAISGLDILIQNYPIIPLSILSTTVMVHLFHALLTDWEPYVNGESVMNFQNDDKFNDKCLCFLGLNADETLVLTKEENENEAESPFLKEQIYKWGLSSKSIHDFIRENKIDLAVSLN